MSQSKNERVPQVAVVGAGYWGKNLVRTFHGLEGLSAVCETSRERLQDLKTAYPGVRLTTSFSEILDDRTIEAVAIATPAGTHAAQVQQALMADKDVMVEKPLCLSVKIGADLVQLARKRDRILMVGHLLWYHPAILKLRETIESGRLGRIQYIYSNRLNFGKIRREENILWSFAPHDISVILGLLSEMPESVQAQAGNYLHQQIADVTVSLLSFPSGVKAHLFVSWLHPYKEQKLVVVGERGMAVFNDVEPENKLTLYSHTIDWRNHVPNPNKSEGDPVRCETVEPLKAECQHFLECVRTRNTPRTDGEEGLRVLKVLEQCQAALGLDPNAAPAAIANSAARKFFAHESAFIDDNVEIGEGTTIWHVSHVMRNSKIGTNCRIGQNVVIGPDVTVGSNVKIQNNVCVYEGVTLEDDVFCGPSMVFTNVFNPRSEVARMNELRPTLVRKGATLGANSTIICGSTVGCYAFVAAGAVVTRNVPGFALVMGNPARITGWMCQCGVKLVFDGEQARCVECERTYHKDHGRVSIVAQAQ